MSYSDSGTDSDDDQVLPFDRLCIGDVILETSDLFAISVIMRPKKKWCYHCHGHKDSELEEFYEDPCSACGNDMNGMRGTLRADDDSTSVLTGWVDAELPITLETNIKIIGKRLGRFNFNSPYG